MKYKKNLIVLVGPTAVGKTTISISLAKKIKGEIISADSMQIYKYMDIGTAKIKVEEMDGIPHYLIDMVYPNEEFTVADYKFHAEKLIKTINSNNKMPIIVGGTGLYVNSLVYKLKFARIEANEKFRLRHNKLADLYGNHFLYNRLRNIDSSSANKINQNDKKRIIRALEIYHETGKPMSFYNKNFREETNNYNLAMVGITMDRSILYEQINKRVDQMVGNGLIDEVKGLLSKGYDKKLVSMKGIGYKEIISYLEGDNSFEEAIETLKRNTRRFAKRQMTWFKRDKRIHWFDISYPNARDNISNRIADYLKVTINCNQQGRDIYGNSN